MSDLELHKKTKRRLENNREHSRKENVLDSKKPKNVKEKIALFFSNPKKRLAFISALGLVFIAIFGTGIYLMTHESKAPEKTTEETPSKKEEAPKKLYQSVLDGTMIEDEAAANRHPLAIMVENDPNARPQSGLDKANIIYETVYDPAATTRFMAIFGNKEAEKVGPVRSVRTFFVDLAHGLDAYLGHWGGNIDALDQIRKEKSPDLDEFAYPGAYWRDRSLGVASDHTGYTSTTSLREQAKKNNYTESNNFNVYRFKDDPKDEQKSLLPETQNVSIDFSNSDYFVNFEYDKSNNNYKRFLAKKPHNDRVSKEQLVAKNIIAMEVKREPTTTRINEPGYTMKTVGTGKAKIFLDGKVISGTWKKESVNNREMFYDDKGEEIVFNRGTFWICIVPSLAQVTSK